MPNHEVVISDTFNGGAEVKGNLAVKIEEEHILEPPPPKRS